MISTILCFSMTISCRKDILVSKSPGFQNQLSIAEAKQYFSTHFQQGKQTKKLMSVSEVKHHTMQDILNMKSPFWENAYEKQISIGQAIKIPINMSQTYAVVNKKNRTIVPFSSLNYLLMYKDSLQKIHTEWVYLQPDSAWLYGNRNQYTGKIVVRTWDGRLLKVHSYPTRSVNNSNSDRSLYSPNTINATSSNIEAPICIDFIYSVQKNCTCTAQYLAEHGCDRCHICVGEEIESFCTWPDPECVLCDDTPPFGGGGGGSGTDPNVGGGVGGGGGGSPGPGDYPPNCNSDPNYTVPTTPPPPGLEWILPCAGGDDIPIPVPLEPVDYLPTANFLINVLGINNINDKEFLNSQGNQEVVNALIQYLSDNDGSPSSKEFVKWAIRYLSITFVNHRSFINEFMPNSLLVTSPDNQDWSNLDEHVLFDPDQVNYPQYQDTQPWPEIKRENVLPFEKFVPMRKNAGGLGVNCLILAKEQLGKAGYSCSGYLPQSQTYQTYKEATGVDFAKTKEAISYLIDALSKKTPVLIGVDNRLGTPSSKNSDNSTDHFVVIVGMGIDENGKYFQFVDNSTNNISVGASYSNRLYYNSSTGKITGKTANTQYRNQAGMHDYIVTQVRKSIKN